MECLKLAVHYKFFFLKILIVIFWQKRRHAYQKKKITGD